MKTSHVYTLQAMHNTLHRSAEETAKAFNHPEVKWKTASGEVKRGDELTAKDLQIGSCNVCKQVRAVNCSVRMFRPSAVGVRALHER